MGALQRLPLLPPTAAAAAAFGQEVPTAFDARQEWPQCLSVGRIRNQGNCGSCWAFGAAEVLADRVCIAGGNRNFTASVEYLLDCDTANDAGCQGGYLDDAWAFLRDVGVPAEACDPYQYCPDPETPTCKKNGSEPARLPAPPPPPLPTGGATPRQFLCPDQCGDGSALNRLRATSAYAVARPGDHVGMQQEILAKGPIEVGFFVFSDFMSYKSGVYFRTPGASGPLGGHAARILGWGVDEAKVPYWLVANSWGPEWGMEGFFRIRRGTNECGIESTPAAGNFHAAAAAKPRPRREEDALYV